MSRTQQTIARSAVVADMVSRGGSRIVLGSRNKPTAKKLCLDYFGAGCSFGASCKFVHSAEVARSGAHRPFASAGLLEARAHPVASKTKLCFDFFAGGCNFGVACKFAHAVEEVRRSQPADAHDGSRARGPMAPKGHTRSKVDPRQQRLDDIVALRMQLELELQAVQKQLEDLAMSDTCRMHAAHLDDQVKEGVREEFSAGLPAPKVSGKGTEGRSTESTLSVETMREARSSSSKSFSEEMDAEPHVECRVVVSRTFFTLVPCIPPAGAKRSKSAPCTRRLTIV